jgi:hypothetical protein
LSICWCCTWKLSCLCLEFMPMLSGVGFPMHRDLDVVYCTSPIEFKISRHTLSAPTREQWYLLTSTFLSEADGTVPPHLPEELEALLGREIADNFAQRPPLRLRFFYVQSNSLKSLPEDLFPEFFPVLKNSTTSAGFEPASLG